MLNELNTRVTAISISQVGRPPVSTQSISLVAQTAFFLLTLGREKAVWAAKLTVYTILYYATQRNTSADVTKLNFHSVQHV